MLRSILSVVAGYVVMAVVVMVGVGVLTLAFPEYKQAPETRVTPVTPMVLELVWAVISATAGGWVTVRLARRSPRPVIALAVIVLVLGAVYGLTADRGLMPGWFLLMLPPVSAMGVCIGGWFGRRPPARTFQ